jgi:hypothetical protein
MGVNIIKYIMMRSNKKGLNSYELNPDLLFGT